MSKNDDTIRRQDAIDALTDFILVDYPTRELAQESAEMVMGTLPSAEPKTGKWDELQTCSVCGKQLYDFIDGYVDGIEYEPNYCPNCGSYNGGDDK